MYKKKSTPFLLLANHRKKEQYIYIKNKIRADFPVTGFYFHTIDCLDDEYNATWSDVYFLSKKYNNVFYNATIEIAQSRMVEAADEAARDVYMDSILQFDDLFKLETSDPVYDKRGKPSAYKLDFSAWDIKRPELGGKSVLEHEHSVVDSILEKKPPVYEEYVIHDDFEFGVGLDMIVDEEKITYDIVNKYIQDFYSKGEVNWKSSQPVDSSKLVYRRDWFVEKKVSLSNAVALERI